MVIVPRLLAIGRIHEVALLFGERVHLGVGDEHFARVGDSPAHVIGVADLAFADRLGFRQAAVAAARANERRGRAGVARDELAERRFGRGGPHRGGQHFVVLVGVYLQRHVHVLKVLLAVLFATELLTRGAATVQHHEHDDDEHESDQHLEETERPIGARESSRSLAHRKHSFV